MMESFPPLSFYVRAKTKRKSWQQPFLVKACQQPTNIGWDNFFQSNVSVSGLLAGIQFVGGFE